MRIQLIIKGLVIALAIYFLAPFALSVTQAQVNPPSLLSKAPVPPKSAPANGQYKVFLPLIISNSTSAPAPTPPPAAPSRKGVPLTYSDCTTITNVKANWEYAWTIAPPSCAGVENVPMMYSGNDINATLGGNSQWLMGFNEPDLSDQANMSLAQATQTWHTIETKYPNKKLLSPAPSGGNPEWLVSFRNAYIAAYGTAPRFDGLAVHCYAWSASDCITHTNKFVTWANAWGVPEIWITEFSFSPLAPYSTESQALKETKSYMNWLSGVSKITRYAWFASKVQGNEAWLSPYFVTPLSQYSSGQLTTFGTTYVSFN